MKWIHSATHPSPNTFNRPPISSVTMNNILAALMFFTRLPFWKIRTVPQECFKHVVSYWSFSGWLTGGIMAMVFMAVNIILPSPVAILTALVARLLVTGALHEDGLADFCDGFGGGTDKASTLRIMKDSHIGTYGVLGLIVYYLLGFNLLITVPDYDIPYLLFCADPFCKFVCSHILWLLPYARKEEESKAKVVYTRLSWKEEFISAVGGLLPLLMLPVPYYYILLIPILVFLCVQTWFRHRLGGYTGDCCGAAFLLSEISFWFGAAIMSYYPI